MELAAAFAAPVSLDLFRRTGGDVLCQVDVAVLLADAFLHATERLPVRRLARVAVVDESGFPASRDYDSRNQLTISEKSEIQGEYD